MICEPCSAGSVFESLSGHDVDMEEKGFVRIPSHGTSTIVVTLLQCPECKDARLEFEVEP